MKLENSMFEIRQEMFRHGGSFVRQMAMMLGHADIENQQRAVDAWPEVFERYDALATLAKQQNPQLKEIDA